jgi:predicted ester cyclase
MSNCSAHFHFGDTISQQIGEGDRVVTYKRITATHQGTFLGIPPGGASIDFEVIDIFRIEANRIAESWLLFDELRFLSQLGALPVEDGPSYER